MNWDRIEENWEQIKGGVKRYWGKLTDDQVDLIAGKRDHLAGRIHEAYGITLEAADRQISTWQANQSEWKMKTLHGTAVAEAIAQCASPCRVIDRRIEQPGPAQLPSERRGR